VSRSQLSRDELDGTPIADALKSPAHPVYVLHGGDHFTVAWRPAPPKEQLARKVRARFQQLTANGTTPNEAAAQALKAAADEMANAPPVPPPVDNALDLAFWNGLPPARALCWLRLRGCTQPLAPAAPSPPAPVPTHWRMGVGEVESIVQAAPADKKARPKCWREHAYELSLVTQKVPPHRAFATRQPSLPLIPHHL
jgi:hypothetical protein